jgi:hypothetical protein
MVSIMRHLGGGLGFNFHMGCIVTLNTFLFRIILIAYRFWNVFSHPALGGLYCLGLNPRCMSGSWTAGQLKCHWSGHTKSDSSLDFDCRDPIEWLQNPGAAVRGSIPPECTPTLHLFCPRCERGCRPQSTLCSEGGSVCRLRAGTPCLLNTQHRPRRSACVSSTTRGGLLSLGTRAMLFSCTVNASDVEQRVFVRSFLACLYSSVLASCLA